MRIFGHRVVLSAAALVLSADLACHREAPSQSLSAPSASAVLGVTPEEGSRVLAKVGDQVITLADYAGALSRMDRFDRMRYQTPDRRKKLLDEMIDMTLLAREAERRGLSKTPETQELVRQILRDEVLRDLRERQPRVEDIPSGEVRAYYDAHRDDFREPERRRISVIVVSDAALAARLLTDAKSADAPRWGELVRKHSSGKPDDPAMPPPVELAGDVGLVTAPASGKNDNPRVPEAVRAAAFEIGAVGTVLDRVVTVEKQSYLVRLTGKNAPRDRTLEEAERTIRVRLTEEKLKAAEAALEQELRQRFPVRIDEKALAAVAVPSAGPPP